MMTTILDEYSSLECILHKACYIGCMYEVVKNKHDIKTIDSWGKTALHIACDNQHYDIVKYLIENNAEINIMDCYGLSPMHSVVNNLQIMKLLLDNGGDINISAEIPIILQVCNSGSLEVLSYLLSRYSTIDILNTYDSYGTGVLGAIPIINVQPTPSRKGIFHTLYDKIVSKFK